MVSFGEIQHHGPGKGILVEATRSSAGQYRAILALDIERSTPHNSAAKAELRESVYRLVEKALVSTGLIDRSPGTSHISPLDLPGRTLDMWFRGALSAVTYAYQWVDPASGNGGTSRALLTPEDSAVSLRSWEALTFVKSAPVRAWSFGSVLALVTNSAAFAEADKAFRRLLAGVLLSLRLILIRVLYVLTRLDEAVAFVLMLIAVRLRYGHRDEPADYSSLLPPRYQTSAGCMSL
jgi:hypothetical protein